MGLRFEMLRKEIDEFVNRIVNTTVLTHHEKVKELEFYRDDLQKDILKGGLDEETVDNLTEFRNAIIEGLKRLETKN